MATNPVAGQTNSGFNLFLRNLQAATTILVSVYSNNIRRLPSVRARLISIQSSARMGGLCALRGAGAACPTARPHLGTYWRDVTAPCAAYGSDRFTPRAIHIQYR